MKINVKKTKMLLQKNFGNQFAVHKSFITKLLLPDKMRVSCKVKKFAIKEVMVRKKILFAPIWSERHWNILFLCKEKCFQQ